MIHQNVTHQLGKVQLERLTVVVEAKELKHNMEKQEVHTVPMSDLGG